MHWQVREVRNVQSKMKAVSDGEKSADTSIVSFSSGEQKLHGVVRYSLFKPRWTHTDKNFYLKLEIFEDLKQLTFKCNKNKSTLSNLSFL